MLRALTPRKLAGASGTELGDPSRAKFLRQAGAQSHSIVGIDRRWSEEGEGVAQETVERRDQRSGGSPGDLDINTALTQELISNLLLTAYPNGLKVTLLEGAEHRVEKMLHHFVDFYPENSNEPGFLPHTPTPRL